MKAVNFQVSLKTTRKDIDVYIECTNNKSWYFLPTVKYKVTFLKEL